MVNDRLQPRRNWSSAGRIAILSSVLFLSGIGSLIFETLWLRLSGLTFGNSIWSAALILSSFMAGMALGNASRPHRAFNGGGRYSFTLFWNW